MTLWLSGDVDPPSADVLKEFEHECRIRDAFAARLADFRPGERVIATEHSYANSKLRGDMRTLDRDNVIRVWEFKIFCGYMGLGQVLTYVAAARLESKFERQVRGVLAAFEFQSEVVKAIEVLNLGIEIILIPSTMKLAGGLLPPPAAVIAPNIPVIELTKEQLS